MQYSVTDSRCVCFGWKSKGIKNVILLLTALWRSTARVHSCMSPSSLCCTRDIGFYSSYERICRLFRSNGIMHAQINWIETAQICVIVLSWLKTKSQIRCKETALISLNLSMVNNKSHHLYPDKRKLLRYILVSFSFFLFLHSNYLLKYFEQDGQPLKPY